MTADRLTLREAAEALAMKYAPTWDDHIHGLKSAGWADAAEAAREVEAKERERILRGLRRDFGERLHAMLCDAARRGGFPVFDSVTGFPLFADDKGRYEVKGGDHVRASKAAIDEWLRAKSGTAYRLSDDSDAQSEDEDQAAPWIIEARKLATQWVKNDLAQGGERPTKKTLAIKLADRFGSETHRMTGKRGQKLDAAYILRHALNDWEWPE